MLWALLAVGALACATPALLDQSRLRPMDGAVVWIAVLGLRAVITGVIALTTLLILPSTEVFTALTHWCAHGAIPLPLLPTHIDVDGHRIGGLALLVPLALVGASALWAMAGIWRAAKAVRRWLGQSSLGEGPRQSLIVGGAEPVVAAAGFRSARVVVSAGALVEMDDAELAAGLEHEWGHVNRRHRFVMALARVLRGLSRPLPGGRLALRHLEFHLERDADEYAVRRTGDALALASAICKVAGGVSPCASSPALAPLAKAGVSERLRLLCSGTPNGTTGSAGSIPRLLCSTTIALTLFVALQAPTVWGEGLQQLRVAEASHIETC